MAVVGGTTSAITGGKFANGAESGAFVHLFNAEQRGFIEGVKEFGRMFGRALKVVTFQDKIYDEIPYTRVGNDAVSAIQNAHPAAQASLGVATTVATAPFTVVAYEYASLQAMLHPEVVIVTGESVIPVLDGYYGGSSPGRNFGSIVSGYENFTGTNITPEVLRP
jgi:hypothetical protein